MKKAISLKDHMKKIASMGGKALFKKRGSGYYSAIAKKGWVNRKRKAVQQP